MEKKDTRSEIVRIGTGIIYRQGYNATGIDTILKEAGVPKGSFYHYFKSKEEFGLAVIDHFAEGFEQRLATFLRDEEVTPVNRIRNFLESGLARVSQNACTRGCLIGNLGQEMADQNERFRERLSRIFAMWRQHIADCLAEAQQAGELAGDLDADLVAGVLLSGWEGAILQTKVTKSPQPMRDFLEVMFSTTLRRQ
ncbi:transcriptional regulator AcuR [Geobacter sp. OR-1]|uniref:TetR/AcrR family transcriptional regulator n=1 Tax=Geobacter sp. OR-1 TaxID=1266765 RepID=UPI000543A5C4|nr:TetR/AcrR family transcriptional regulator [Geobacter sp. OR-1]GAM10904.1 transcriptional regulator AcuR [Geobacter sp. OR-1]